ncbi:MAG: dehydrogenase, partial [Candidatus Krumholzibacteriota bacterium]|nr:dehydrogenase [Candidatus Krumholzibacteriota bacterium]
MPMENAFNPVTGEILEALARIVGHEHVMTDEEAVGKYASDETEDFVFPPDAVVLPATTAEVSAIMRLAWEHAIPVTPRAGGTGLSGGALPIHGGIVLAFERMNRIIEIDTDNLMAVAEPGVITQELQEAVEKVGLYYPPDPASRGSCRLGGNLAECAGGPHAVKYGVTKDYVLGIEAVLADGTVIHHGGKLLKNSTGFNLTQLIVGSEGTLAVITKIFLKLVPLPCRRIMLLIPFPALEAAARTVPAIMNAG